MGGFANPGKAGQQAASGQQAAEQGILQQMQQYIQQQNTALRAGIGQIQNPYFSAAGGLSPQQVNPYQTQTFGTPGGSYMGPQPGQPYLGGGMSGAPPQAPPPGGYFGGQPPRAPGPPGQMYPGGSPSGPRTWFGPQLGYGAGSGSAGPPWMNSLVQMLEGGNFSQPLGSQFGAGPPRVENGIPNPMTPNVNPAQTGGQSTGPGQGDLRK